MEASPGPGPIAIGLMVCDQVIVDKDTKQAVVSHAGP